MKWLSQSVYYELWTKELGHNLNLEMKKNLHF